MGDSTKVNPSGKQKGNLSLWSNKAKLQIYFNHYLETKRLTVSFYQLTVTCEVTEAKPQGSQRLRRDVRYYNQMKGTTDKTALVSR